MANTIKVYTYDVTSIKIGTSNVDAVYVGTEKVYPSTTPSPKNYLRLVCKGSGTLTFTGGGVTSANTLSYSSDSGVTWSTLENGVASPSFSSGDIILLKGTNMLIRANAGIGQFSSTFNFDIEGNVMSLLYGDNFENETSLSGKDYVFMNLFSGSSVVSAENMELPASTLSEWCYTNMFNRCSSLTKAPTTLPAETLQNSCYFNMFYACTELTTTPILPALTLVTDCYKQMFRGCSKVNYIKAMFTTAPGTSYTSNWVYGVASRGTYVKNSSASYTTRGTSAIPNNWTIQTASS